MQKAVRTMDTITWKIDCITLPTAARHCKKCGQVRAFECSGCFRVNAQKRLLDVWLIYKCPECDDTWNLPVLSRVPPQMVPAALLDGFHRNDAALARRYALDGELMRRGGATPGVPELRVTGDMPPIGRRVMLALMPECALTVRVAAVLRMGLGLSRGEFERMVADGRLRAGAGDVTRMKLGSGARVEIEL